MKTKIISSVLAFMVFFSVALPAMAKDPYDGYIYNSYGEKVPSPNAYLPKEIITGVDLGIGQMNKPSDVFVDSEEDIYILDGGNNRIIILDKTFKLKKVIDKFTLKDTGEESPLKDAAGIFATPNDGLIYIADKGNQRVAVCDINGVIVRQEFKPKTELLGKEILFSPRKVVVNSIGTMFVLSDNINQGLVSIDNRGIFQGFFGAEKIQLTATQMVDLWWRSFSSKEQIKQTTTFQPTEYANIFLGKNDFIYTATSLETYTKAQIKRLNPTGTNILKEAVTYGDLSGEMVDKVLIVSAIIDVTVDKDGFIFALDRNFGHVYMYDEQSWNLSIFGKKDYSFGCFSEPVGIENVNGNVIVLDTAKAALMVFKPTEYGSYIREAVNYHYQGKYGEALAPWQTVKKLNDNYEFAYAGIGRAQYMEQDYKSAMNNFKLANNKDLYSVSKKKYRTATLRENFNLYAISFLALIIGGYVLVKKRKNISTFIISKRKGGKSI